MHSNQTRKPEETSVVVEMDASKLKKEFPGILSIKESLIKYAFEPNKKT